jgi:hypothetical protein
MASEAPAGTGGGVEEGEGEQLLGREPPADEHWPPWWKKYLNDFLPAKQAKNNDGMRSPQFEDAPWTEGPGALTPVVLDAARRRHDQAEIRIAVAEQRSERLAQRALTLLALAFVAVGYQASTLRDQEAPVLLWALALLFGGSAIAMLAIAAIEAIGVDRVGYTQPADPGEAATYSDEGAQRRSLAMQEHRAARMANWTARHKVNEFLQARAWLTRGITALVLSGVLGVAIWTCSGDTTEAPKDDGPAAGANGPPRTTTSPTPARSLTASASTLDEPPVLGASQVRRHGSETTAMYASTGSARSSSASALAQ